MFWGFGPNFGLNHSTSAYEGLWVLEILTIGVAHYTPGHIMPSSFCAVLDSLVEFQAWPGVGRATPGAAPNPMCLSRAAVDIKDGALWRMDAAVTLGLHYPEGSDIWLKDHDYYGFWDLIQ